MNSKLQDSKGFTMKRFLSNLFAGISKSAKRPTVTRTVRSANLSLESLEDRLALSHVNLIQPVLHQAVLSSPMTNVGLMDGSVRGVNTLGENAKVNTGNGAVVSSNSFQYGAPG